MSYALVIDDNRQMAEALCRMLGMCKLQTRAALSPAAGLAIMKESVPQVVFLDISMPGVTGFEVLAFLRREPALAEVPVIIVTSDDQPETKARALNSGAQGLIVKPVVPEALEAILRQLGLLS
jgi:CheY-like chemotaxis protein